MKKSFLLPVIALIIFTAPKISFGQASFSHSVGAAFYVSTSTVSSENFESTSTIGSPGILYSPRINLVELDREMTISVGTHLGFGMNYDRITGNTSLAFDLPILAEINFGHGAHPNTRSSIGGFAGLGYGINRLGFSNELGASSNRGSGPILNGGVRALINDVPVGFRLSYLLNMEEGGNVAGLGIFYTFGFR